METGIIIGVDPHRRTFTATALDHRGGEVGSGHFANSRTGYQQAVEWAQGLGEVQRWGVEGASGLGRHLAEFLAALGLDVRDVPPHRTANRQRGATKASPTDSTRIASLPRPRPTRSWLGRSSMLHLPSQTRCASVSPCGITLGSR